MKGYGIEIKNNLLEPKHVKAIGSSIWEYLWILDRITKIDDDGLGYVHGGVPVNLNDLGTELGIHPTNISRNLNKLSKEGYINLVRTPYGIKISVNKAHKRFANTVGRDLAKTHGDLAKTHGDLAKTPNVIKTVTKTVTKTGRAHPYGSTTYLTNIPLEDISLFKEKYQVTTQQIKTKGEQLANWCEAKGRVYKNYRAFLMNALLDDYGLRSSNGYTRV